MKKLLSVISETVAVTVSAICCASDGGLEKAGAVRDIWKAWERLSFWSAKEMGVL